MTHDEAFEILVKDGTIYEPPYDAIFDLVNAIMDRNVNLAFNLLQQSYEVGEATMVMLSVLYNNFKNLLQVKTYQGNDMVKGTGLTPWQIKCVKPYVGKHDTDRLIYKLRLITKVTNGIKTGKMEDEFAMQYLLVHIM